VFLFILPSTVVFRNRKQLFIASESPASSHVIQFFEQHLDLWSMDGLFTPSALNEVWDVSDTTTITEILLLARVSSGTARTSRDQLQS
jgi:hypothetical protein